MSRSCPRCRLLNPPSARRCDCGYDFVAERWVRPETSPRARGPWGTVAAVSGTLLAVAAVRLALPNEHVHGDPGFIVAALATPVLLLVTGVSLGLRRRDARRAAER